MIDKLQNKINYLINGFHIGFVFSFFVILLLTLVWSLHKMWKLRTMFTVVSHRNLER
jgi:hypothetical protein